LSVCVNCHLVAARPQYQVLGNARTFGFQKTRGQKLASLEAGVGPGLIIEDLTEKTETLETSGVSCVRNIQRNVNAVGSSDSQYIAYLVNYSRDVL